MKPMVYKLLISFFFICANHNSIIAQSSSLDGNSYNVILVQQGGDSRSFNWKRDTFIFESGEMYAVSMKREEGFGSALYTPINNNSNQDQVINFTYYTKNKYGSTLQINGTAQGNVIKGKIIWTSDAGVHDYLFTGTLIE